jgi:hypothetical protein
LQSAERTLAIRRPVDEVFRFLSDARTATQWRSGELSISAVEADSRIEFRAMAGRIDLDGGFALEAMGEATILTCTLRAEPRGWRGLVARPLVPAVLDRELAALDELRDLLER